MRKKTLILILVLAVFLILAVFCSFQIWRSYNCLTVTEYRYATDKLTQPVHAVLIADLHDHSFGDDNQELTAQIEALAPDVILMDGDFINEDSEDADVALDLVRRLSALAPVYYAMGNHELGYMAQTGHDLTADLKAAGATVLDLDYTDLSVNGQAIRLGGMFDYAFALDGNDSTIPEHMAPEVYGFLTDYQDTNALTLMLAHRPESFILGEAADTWEIDLVLSGHAHGGQVVLPWLGGLWAPEQGWLPDYVHGLYTKGMLDILITSGLGSQIRLVPRFNNPPEIISLTLTPEQSL